MLRNAWYAIGFPEALQEGPLKAVVHGEEFLVYRRAAGDCCALDARCPHRGCDLSLGKLSGEGEWVCPFHGWRFGADGRCTQVPANRGGRIPARARLNRYPVCAAAGLLWLYTAPAEPPSTAPPLRMPPELISAEWAQSRFSTVWRAHFTRVVESVLDVSHLPFVHPETTGRDVDPAVKGPLCTVRADGLLIRPAPFAAGHPMEPSPPPPGSEEQTEIELLFPNQWMIRTPMGEDNRMCTYLTFTPEGGETTRIFGALLRNFDREADWLTEFHREHTRFVMSQDQAIVESLRPRVVPFSLREEAHVPSDAPALHYRTLLARALEREEKGPAP